MQVEGKVLAKIFAWCEHHQRTSDDHPSWESTFVQVTTTELGDIMTAASYLQIDRLSHLCAKTIAERITGKSASQLHLNLNLSDAFAQEDSDDITRENDGHM